MFGGHRKGKRGWGAAGKIIVLGILQRNGKVKVFPVQGRKGEEITKLVREHTKPGSLYYTDDRHAYGSLAIRGDHTVVRKEDEDIFPLIYKMLRSTGYHEAQQFSVRFS